MNRTENRFCEYRGPRVWETAEETQCRRSRSGRTFLVTEAFEPSRKELKTCVETSRERTQMELNMIVLDLGDHV